MFLQRQGALGAILADRGRGWLLRTVRGVRGLQAPLLQRPQGLPVLVSPCGARVSARPRLALAVVGGLWFGDGSSREGPEASRGGSLWGRSARQGKMKPNCGK